MIVVVHVEDFLVSAKRMKVMEHFMKDLSGLFAIRDLGAADYYRGCYLTRHRKRSSSKWINISTSKPPSTASTST